jgi:hypothetical protein
MPTPVICTNGDTAIIFTNLTAADAFLSDPLGSEWRVLAYDPHTFHSAGDAIDYVLEGQQGPIEN